MPESCPAFLELAEHRSMKLKTCSGCRQDCCFSQHRLPSNSSLFRTLAKLRYFTERHQSQSLLEVVLPSCFGSVRSDRVGGVCSIGDAK